MIQKKKSLKNKCAQLREMKCGDYDWVVFELFNR